MFEYTVKKISPTIFHITDVSGTSMFLAVGREKAALIDTGIGIRGLDSCIRSLTELPLTVILTHGHLDHAGGSILFDEVYVHPEDAVLIAQGSKAERLSFAVNNYRFMKKLERREGETEFLIEEEEMEPYMLETAEADKTYLKLEDGMVFELGGVTLEIISVPGHTKGSCCILFREERSILFGDACNPNTLLYFEHSTPVSVYMSSLERLGKWEDRYDTVYLSHGGPEIDRLVREDNLSLCEEILAGKDDHEAEIGLNGEKCFRARKTRGWQRIDGGLGNIVYNDRTRC